MSKGALLEGLFGNHC